MKEDLFIKPKPRENNENPLYKIKAQIEKLIKDREKVKEYSHLIGDAVAAYDNPQEAAKILNDCFKKYLVVGFDEKSFERFVHSIDPRFISKAELQEAFFKWNNSDEDCTMENVGKCADGEALCDGDCEKNFFPIQRKKMIAEQKKNPARMQSMKIYAMLQDEQLTDQDRLRMDLAPNEGPDPFDWKRMPKIPFGGAPGYKMKRRRP
jgi:hypothetical protein